MAVKKEIIDDIMEEFLDRFGARNSLYSEIRELVEYAYRKGYESAIDNYMINKKNDENNKR